MILAIDQGTTATTCMLFDERMEPIGRASAELTQSFPRPGWVEHDLNEIWELVQRLAAAALLEAGVEPSEVIAVGITNQRETVCAWDAATGEPLHSAIVWQDRRTAKRCEQLRAQGMEPLIRKSTGLVLDPYFSATKMQWLLQHLDGLQEKAASGGALLGTIDSWLAFKLTGEHVTDPSNASRTMLYDLAGGGWDPELLDLFGVPAKALARIVPSAGPIAELRPAALGAIRAPLSALVGDQQSALFGQACVNPGMGKNTYGTGSFVLLNAGFTAPEPAQGMLGTVGWELGGRRSYALEASIFVTGAAVQWLRDGLGLIDSAQETEQLAARLEGNDGVYFVPALTGLGSPHWMPEARGTIVGLTRGAGKAHLARATLEAIAYQTCDAVAAMEQACGQPLRELRVDGGATANRWLMQFQADVLGVPVLVPEIAETTALGAALLAGVGVGAWSMQDVHAGWRERAVYEPAMSEAEREPLLEGWRRALAQARAGCVADVNAPGA
jgi:glycerol kinase